MSENETSVVNQQQNNTEVTQQWYSSAPVDLQDWMRGKGLVSDNLTGDIALNAINGWRNAEKIIGVPVDRVVKLPQDENTEAWNDVYTKLGKPEDKNKYELTLGDAPDQNFVEWAKDAFHKANLTNRQAKDLSTAWNEHIAKVMQEQASLVEAKRNTDAQDLQKEWGAVYDERANVVDRVAMQLGMDEQSLASLQKAMGVKGAMNFLYGIGAKTGEADFIKGGNSGGFANMTPEDAKARIRNLGKDADFMKKYVGNNTEARAEMDRLHKLAYGA